MSHGPPVNSIVVRPLDSPLARTLGLVQRHGRVEPPALRIVREAVMALRSDAGGWAAARALEATTAHGGSGLGLLEHTPPQFLT